jgi:hypothetical protein
MAVAGYRMSLFVNFIRVITKSTCCWCILGFRRFEITVVCNISVSVYSDLSVMIIMSESFVQFIFHFPDKVP